ncbi:MAG: DUF2892 domain-containing protein [Gammaproteobacteria bacterium]|nr:DUF2892 domain-containing protein [Gammaproteobacteria bacterium]
MGNNALGNLGIVERIVRVGFGYGLIVAVLSVSAPTQFVLLLPLIAIYPVLTGMFGWDPVYELVGRSIKAAALSIEKLKRRRGTLTPVH